MLEACAQRKAPAVALEATAYTDMRDEDLSEEAYTTQAMSTYDIA